jgi:hypothetical protein
VRASAWIGALALAAVVTAGSGCGDHQAAAREQPSSTTAARWKELPLATAADFPDLPAVTEAARQEASSNGDDNPNGAVIVKTTRGVYLEALASAEMPRAAPTDVYVVVVHGAFPTCRTCHGSPGGGTFPPSHDLSFTWDPSGHGILDFGYGPEPDPLPRSLGTAYRLAL